MLASLPFLLGGLANTLLIAAASGFLALVLSFVVGSFRHNGSASLRFVLAAYVEFFRGTSLLLQLFWFYFVLPLLGVDLSAMTVAIVGIGLNYGAYGSEVMRGALSSVPRGQTEAARAMGLRRAAVFRLVVLPQALPIVVQPLGALAIQLLKATSLASLITISELSFRAYQLNQLTSQTGLIFGIVLALYFASAQLIVLATHWADRSTGRWRRAGRLGPAARAKPVATASVPVG